MTALLKYDAACKAIAEAKTVDEVTDWIDKAAAVREYGRRIKNRQMEFDAVEIRVRAKKRRGQLLIELKEKGQIREGKAKLSTADDSLPRVTLADLGITADESAEEQKIAGIEGDSFERLVARCRAYAEAHPQRHSFDVLKPPPEGPINGARALMGSRAEPDDSLDYFPTPPWATRALIEVVFPHLGVRKIRHACEPACGEGHIAEVLRETIHRVDASDIANYGYDGRDAEETIDFLEPWNPHARAEWIITNPPFDDLAARFVLKALEDARIGVAMFFRLQWIPTKDRYEKIFRDTPPTLVAFFSERVNLCKGRWDPDGSTATDYIWLVWIKGEQPRPPFWIPPGQRQALEHADDRERFTTHPVTQRPYDSPFDEDGEPLPYDRLTGELFDPPAPPPVITEDDKLDIPQFLRRREPDEART